jgi:predicted ATPase/DNA-binding NarL/FixJ family response regulator
MMTVAISGRWRAQGPPAELTSFVGRRRETADVKRLLTRSRLVTLTGVGGVGKTRLAHRVTAQLHGAFPGGVWLVELAELEDPALLAETVAEAVEVQDHSSRSAMEALVDHLRPRTALVVLDNCEHLLRECAVLADTLLRRASGVRILATSREVLGIAGEQTLAVPVLPLPPSGDEPLSAFVQYDAVRLFAERAQAVLPNFAITPENRADVEAICRRLDGIPLAIELAAVRLRALSVEQLLDRLDDRFGLLDRGSQTVLPRHRTLRALIDWSHGLCTPQERLLWARASVFAGGLDLEAAEAICAGEGIARDDVLDVVTAMVNKSVLLREEHPCGIRYRLLETMRQYGRERLAESGEEAVVQRRHRDFYRLLCDEVRTRLFGPGQVALLIRLKLENANLRAALEYCFATPAEAGSGVQMAADLLYHWLSGYLREGRRRLDQGLAIDREPGRRRARALVVNSWLAVAQGQTGAATEMLEESRRIGEVLDDERIRADVALHRGLLALDRGDAGAAIALCEEAVVRHRRTGDPAGLAMSLMWLTAGRTLREDLSGALTAGEEGIALCEARGEDLHRAYLMTMVGVTLWRQGETRRASALAEESLAFHRSLHNPRGIGINLSLLAWLADADGDHERAARLLGVLKTFAQAPGAYRAIGAPISGYRHLLRFQEECEADIRRAIGEGGADAALRWGAGLGPDEALAYALREDVSAETAHRPVSLTRRESEVARLIAEGMSNRRIAAELVISQRTVEGHVEHVLTKLGFTSRTQIAVWVREREDRSTP